MAYPNFTPPFSSTLTANSAPINTPPCYCSFTPPYYSTFTTVPAPSPNPNFTHDYTPPSPNPYPYTSATSYPNPYGYGYGYSRSYNHPQQPPPPPYSPSPPYYQPPPYQSMDVIQRSSDEILQTSQRPLNEFPQICQEICNPRSDTTTPMASQPNRELLVAMQELICEIRDSLLVLRDKIREERLSDSASANSAFIVPNPTNQIQATSLSEGVVARFAMVEPVLIRGPLPTPTVHLAQLGIATSTSHGQQKSINTTAESSTLPLPSPPPQPKPPSEPTNRASASPLSPTPLPKPPDRVESTPQHSEPAITNSLRELERHPNGLIAQSAESHALSQRSDSLSFFTDQSQRSDLITCFIDSSAPLAKSTIHVLSDLANNVQPPSTRHTAAFFFHTFFPTRDFHMPAASKVQSAPLVQSTICVLAGFPAYALAAVPCEFSQSPADGSFSFNDVDVVLFKQWDPGKIILWANFYNLEDKVGLDGVWNVRNNVRNNRPKE